MRIFLCLCMNLLASFSLAAQELNMIVPRPDSLKVNKGSFRISSTTVLVVRNGADNSTSDFFNSYLKTCYGFTLKKVKSATGNFIEFATLQTFVPGKEGAYRLFSAPGSIVIQGQTASGTFYGMQTLIQLLPVQKTRNSLAVPAVEIIDEPRFEYRGMHLDAARHFFPVAFIKKYIDYLALHKFNTFHWHLTDDQGWRIEIKKYPLLTRAGAWRNGTIIGRYPGQGSDNNVYGGFYTQEQIREVVRYARDRYIDVVPEIEMPGHGSAAIAGYPWLSCFPEKPTLIPAKMISSRSVEEQKKGRIKLVQETWGVFDDVFCAGKDSTFSFLQNVIDEVTELFPSRYFHVGGDECPKTHWKLCPRCQQRMKDLGLKNEHELQSYFIQRIEKYLNGKGKTLIGWDEILEGGLAPNAIVMSWRGEAGGIEAARLHHKVIMTPGNPVYFDHSQSQTEDSVTIGGYNPIEKVYAYDPVPSVLSSDDGKFVIGAQANLWTEYIANARKVEYMVFPRMAALSEVLWSRKEFRKWEDFEKRLRIQFSRYDLWKANYSRAYFQLKAAVVPAADNNGLNWKISNRFENANTTFFEIIEPERPQIDSTPVYSPKDPSKNTGWKTKWSTIKKVRLNSGTTINPAEISLNHSGLYRVEAVPLVPLPGSSHYIADTSGRLVLEQAIHFNKITGSRISLTIPPADKYPGDGAFTLVNGIQNDKGLARSREFLGFEGEDCDTRISLGKIENVSSVTVHFFQQKSSWIWAPGHIEVYGSADGQQFLLLASVEGPKTSPEGNGTVNVPFASAAVRYLRVLVRNNGTIPEGNAGAGNKTWLFVDEIEAN